MADDIEVRIAQAIKEHKPYFMANIKCAALHAIMQYRLSFRACHHSIAVASKASLSP